MKDLLLYIAQNLVEHPEQVTVTEVENGDELTLQLRVAPEDMGKVIGRQGRIAKEVLHSTRHNGDIGRMVKGLMIESYLLDGCQKPDGGVYGLSITDPCIGWEKTEQLVLELADLR